MRFPASTTAIRTFGRSSVSFSESIAAVMPPPNTQTSVSMTRGILTSLAQDSWFLRSALQTAAARSANRRFVTKIVGFRSGVEEGSEPDCNMRGFGDGGQSIEPFAADRPLDRSAPFGDGQALKGLAQLFLRFDVQRFQLGLPAPAGIRRSVDDVG